MVNILFRYGRKGQTLVITYDYYRIFYHVVQCHSFTGAAEVLGNNQPNVTRCMNNLEHELGCKLFVRSNRGVSLTPEGERLYRRVAIAVEQLQIGEREVAQDCGLVSGTISIGVSETALHLLLLRKLSQFHHEYPGVRLKITNDSTPKAVAALVSGETDCAVVTTPVHNLKKPIRSTNLLTFQDILLCGNYHRRLAEHPLRLRDLEPYSFICMGKHTGTYEFYQSLFIKHDLPFRVDMEVTTMDQVLPMIRYNLGIGFYPESLAEKAIQAGEVNQIRLVEQVPKRSVCLIEDTSKPQSIAMKTLRQMFLKGLD